ncbi:MAG: 4-hydroxy-3-methylbut-2-enyl diphosphate reductase [Pseudomonadota bacterium]|nr:4-hydroxy-3-methylbut-2-enyl diphosphate reductase [Pseudomonadota bacterium]
MNRDDQQQNATRSGAAAMRRPLRVILAQPRGFCAGVVRAIEVVERELDHYGAPIYVLHEIVHNQRVVADLRARGARFVESLTEVPAGARVVFSAHGVPRSAVIEAADQGLAATDATCPLVTKVHVQGQRYVDQGCELLLIGHAGHPEVIGTLGQIRGPVSLIENLEDAQRVEVADPSRVAYVTQTTLSVDDTRAIIEVLKSRFPDLRGPDVRDICYATQNRQNAVRQLAGQVDLVLVVGAANSSNSRRLVEVALAAGCDAYRIAEAGDMRHEWLDDVDTLGITAGASAPEILIEELLDRLRSLREVTATVAPGPDETIVFKPPANHRALLTPS